VSFFNVVLFNNIVGSRENDRNKIKVSRLYCLL